MSKIWLTGVAYSRAKRRKQIFIATSSVGPELVAIKICFLLLALEYATPVKAIFCS